MKNNSAGCFFSDGSKCLILFRLKDYVWGIPAGHLRDYEEPLDGAKRECREEIGRFPAESTLVGQEEKNGFTTFIYKIEKPFPIKLNDEHSGFEWVNHEDLKDYNLHPNLNYQKYIRMLDGKFAEWIKNKGHEV